MKNYITILSALLFLLSSCSVNKQIARTANKSILNDKIFEHAHTGIAIFDPAQNKFLYDYQGEKYFVPASNTKLLTCYLAMKYLGDSIAGIQYQIINDSTVIIKGTGDPTFMHPDFAHQPALDFLKKFKQVRIASTGFKDYLGSGWSWDDYEDDYMAPRSGMPLYGDFVRFDTRQGYLSVQPPFFQNNVSVSGDISSGISVDRPWETNTFTVSPGRRKQPDVPFVPDDQTIAALLSDTLKTTVSLTGENSGQENYIYSQPLDSMLTIMMHRSDNFFAEQSLLMVSKKLTGEMNDRTVIKKILESDFKDMPQKPSWVDGSGLSHYNLLSPKDFVFLLEKMKNDFGLDRLKVILPTGGTGTLSSLYKDDAGYIFAKTGTLNSVVALSGYLITRKNKLLLFSVLVNNHQSASQDIRKGIEKLLTEVRRRF